MDLLNLKNNNNNNFKVIIEADSLAALTVER